MGASFSPQVAETMKATATTATLTEEVFSGANRMEASLAGEYYAGGMGRNTLKTALESNLDSTSQITALRTYARELTGVGVHKDVKVVLNKLEELLQNGDVSEYGAAVERFKNRIMTEISTRLKQP